MWQTDYSRMPSDGGLTPALPVRQLLLCEQVERTSLLFWMEHCIECAFPHCYSVCPLYIARDDAKCARFAYGIFPNPHFNGLFEYGAEVQFRRWGKLESKLGFGTATPAEARKAAAGDRRALALVNPPAAALQRVNPTRKLNGAYHLLREQSLRSRGKIRTQGQVPFDAFVMEVFNPPGQEVTLILECTADKRVTYHQSFRLAPGHNHFTIPFEDLQNDLRSTAGRIRVYPDHDAEPRLVFSWLDFVRYSKDATRSAITPAIVATVAPATKVKCVAFDLDNTLWQGILVENGPDALVPHQDIIDLIHQLDARGIICTVLSKNDHEAAMAVIERLGLTDYLIAPAINWEPKSGNLQAIADELNIGIDTFAVIDDSPFERQEIATMLPQVRVFAETEIHTLLDRPEFDVPQTDVSKSRRLSYLAEGQRKTIARGYGGDYDAFLRSCEMRAHVFRPESEADIQRCLELIQRSNQLNFSNHRYEQAEFKALLANPDTLPMALSVSDIFGNYGIVGFASIELGGEVPVLRDLVISCRIAKKKIEHAWFAWIAAYLHGLGADRLLGQYQPTARNGVLLDTLLELGFTDGTSAGSARLVEFSFASTIAGAYLVTVTSSGFAGPVAEPPHALTL